jgi:serine/threonine protein kinase
MQTEACFDSIFLNKAAQGDVSSDEFDQLAEHIQSCDRCMQRFDEAIFADARNFVPGPAEHVVERGPVPLLERFKAVNHWEGQPGLGQRFQVIRQLGRGGMGEVYECFDKKLNRVVAVKLIRADRLTGELFERLNREARIQAALNHPNIVQIYETGEVAGVPFIAMEFVAGQTLHQHLNEKPLEPRQAAALVARVARGMHYAHQAGVLHRDLKPSNILLGESEFDCNSGKQALMMPKVADFGLAKLLETPSQLSKSDMIVGTTLYLSPEQAAGRKGAIGPGADIYSIGVILYESLTGHPPFNATSAGILLAMIEGVPPVSPRKLVAGISKDLETITLKCLEKEPGRRYQSAGELADDLERYLKGQPIVARPMSRLGHVLRWSSRNRSLAAALAMVIILSVGLMVGLLYFSIQQSILRSAAEIESKRSRLLAEQLTVQRDGAVKNYLREFEMLSNLTALLINNPSKELAVLRETSLRQYQVILDNLMTDSYIVENHGAEVTIFLYQAARLGEATGDEPLMVRRIEQMMKLAAEPRNQKQPEITFDLLAIQMLARHYEGKSNTLAGVEVWGSAWRWISHLDADLIKKTPGLSVEAVNIAGKYQEGLKNLGLSDKVKEVGRELQELQSRLVSKSMINTH